VVEKRKTFWECLPIIVKLFWLETKFIIIPSGIYIYIYIYIKGNEFMFGCYVPAGT
jgi:hypothetical protein